MQAIKRTLLAWGLFALSAGPASALFINDGAAHAFTLASTGGGYNLVVNGTVRVVSGYNSNSLTLEFVVTNASTLLNNNPVVPANNVRLVSIGFNSSPNATGVAFSDVADGGFVNAYIPGPPPPNLPSLPVEVCAFGGNNCAGGGPGGLDALASDTFRLILAGTWTDFISLDLLGVKFQTNNGSFEFGCTNSDCEPSFFVPEPHTLALLGLGLIALAFVRRRADA